MRLAPWKVRFCLTASRLAQPAATVFYVPRKGGGESSSLKIGIARQRWPVASPTDTPRKRKTSRRSPGGGEAQSQIRAKECSLLRSRTVKCLLCRSIQDPYHLGKTLHFSAIFLQSLSIGIAARISNKEASLLTSFATQFRISTATRESTP